MAENAIHFTIRIGSNLEALIDDSVEFSKLLGPQQQGQMNNYVVSQLEDKDGAPTLTDFQVSNIKFTPVDLKGSFRVHFKISRQFCCSDFTSCQSDYIDFRFTQKHEELYVTGTYTLWTIQ